MFQEAKHSYMNIPCRHFYFSSNIFTAVSLIEEDTQIFAENLKVKETCKTQSVVQSHPAFNNE